MSSKKECFYDQKTFDVMLISHFVFEFGCDKVDWVFIFKFGLFISIYLFKNQKFIGYLNIGYVWRQSVSSK